MERNVIEQKMMEVENKFIPHRMSLFTSFCLFLLLFVLRVIMVKSGTSTDSSALSSAIIIASNASFFLFIFCFIIRLFKKVLLTDESLIISGTPVLFKDIESVKMKQSYLQKLAKSKTIIISVKDSKAISITWAKKELVDKVSAIFPNSVE